MEPFLRPSVSVNLRETNNASYAEVNRQSDFCAGRVTIVDMKRYIYKNIIADLSKKMVFLTGPSQVGKTFLSKQIMQEFKNPVYLNFDDVNDARVIKQKQWSVTADLVVFDEVHKMKGWKTFLKGAYDTKGKDQMFLVTGSARMDTFRQAGDSLAGRYFHYTLNPISVYEGIHVYSDANVVLERICNRGGFPKPFLAKSENDARRWQNQYYVDLVREDIVGFSRITEVRSMQLLLELLRS